MKISSVLLIIFGTYNYIFSQTVPDPNYSLKSHETLFITEIEITAVSTVIHMTIENKIEGGTFCADKNLFILYPDGKKSKLLSSAGIPVCPDTYKFSYSGEKLEFILTFPPLKAGTEWIDLIEDCSDNCFYFYGILLNGDLNKRIEEAFAFAEKNERTASLSAFEKILGEVDIKKTGIAGLLYINIIKLATLTGDEKKASEYYNRFRISDSPRLSSYLKFLTDQGIKY